MTQFQIVNSISKKSLGFSAKQKEKNVLSHAANKSCTTTLAVCKKTFACRLTTVNDYTAAKLTTEEQTPNGTENKQHKKWNR